MRDEFICIYCRNTGIVPSVGTLMQDFCGCDYGEQKLNIFLYKAQFKQNIDNDKKLEKK